MNSKKTNQTWICKSALPTPIPSPSPSPNPTPTSTSTSQTSSQNFRYLRKDQLGGVIFGTKHETIDECLKKQLFGLPSAHFQYVQNISPGLPLFLFNYSDRKLYGIFEAASSGLLNIDPYGWTTNGSHRTSFPAQVQIRVRLQCEALTERQFGSIISTNYYRPSHFWFELDHAQTNKLMSLFSSQVLPPGVPFVKVTARHHLSTQPSFPQTWNKPDEQIPLGVSADSYYNHSLSNGDSDLTHSLQDLFGGPQSAVDYVNLETRDERSASLAVDYERSNSSTTSLEKNMVSVDEKCIRDDTFQQVELVQQGTSLEKNTISVNERCMRDDTFQQVELVQQDNGTATSALPSNLPCVLAQLMQEMEELKASKKEQTVTINQLKRTLMESKSEIRQLKERCTVLESACNLPGACSNSKLPLDRDDTIFLLGGYDGQSWLASLDAYSPSKDVMQSLQPMNSIRSYASVAFLNGDLYVVGGNDNQFWCDSVESYDLANNEWLSCPPLKGKKGSLATVTLDNKIFAMGGGNGVECLSEVEMFDPDAGRWITSRSMLQKRFALAAVGLNNAIYAVGGYDGKDYLSSAERFDPREHSWSKIESMNSVRGCHSLVVLQEKLYALGGYSGTSMVPTVEVFDPRRGTWIAEDSMNHARGYSSAVVLGDSIYVIGGVTEVNELAETVELYKDGEGWQQTDLVGIGKRSFAAAIVL